MVITIGKCKISGAALLTLAAALFFDSAGVLTASCIAAAFHEAGHFVALKLGGRQINEMRIDLWGLTIHCENRMSYAADIITALSGPLASLLLAIAAALVGRYCYYPQAYVTAGISLIFCVFNALPALPLDGGKIAYAAAALLFGIDKAERMICVSSCIVIMGLLVAGTVLLLFTRTNFTLLLAAVWLLISYCKRSGVSIKSKRKIIGSESWKKS